MLESAAMTTLTWIVLFTGLGGLLSVSAAGIFMVLPGGWRERLLPHLISFATGALLGAALIAILPHAIEAAGASAHELGYAITGGILLFFVLEKLVLWRHSHDHSHDCADHVPLLTKRAETSAYLVLVGDTLHNFVDGLVIGAAFLANVHLGIASAVAIIAHEIPQEVGDFAILLRGGFKRGTALALNLMSSLAAVVGGVVAYFALGHAQAYLPWALALAVSSLLYVAVADLIPGLHERTETKDGLAQVALILAGVAVIAYAHSHAH
jgi:zinc and cadmium transporter